MLLSQRKVNERKKHKTSLKKHNSASSCSFLSHWRVFWKQNGVKKCFSLMKQLLCKAVQNIVFPLTRINADPELLMRLCMRRFSRQMPPLGLYLLLVFFSRRFCPAKLLNAIFRASESGTWDRRKLYFRCAQGSRRPTTQHCGNVLPPPPNDENRLNHGQN